MGSDLVRGFLGAVSLLTRIPARGDVERRTVPWLPVVGALIGAAVAGTYALLAEVLSPAAAATLAVAAGVLLTGALHEDGLGDVADAFGARADRARTLEILKDPRHGTYGVLAIALSVIGRIAAVAGMDAVAAAAALPVAHAIGRSTSGGLMWLLPPAADDGLGARYAANTTRRHAAAAGAIGLALALGILGAWGLVAAIIAVAGAAIAGALALRRIGGITGDVLGAAEQLAEIGVLMLCAAVGAGIPWWRA